MICEHEWLYARQEFVFGNSETIKHEIVFCKCGKVKDKAEEERNRWLAAVDEMKNEAEMCMYGDPDKEISEEESTVWATQLSVLSDLLTRMEATK